MFGWALAIGLVAPFIGRGISILAIAIRARVEPRMVLLMPVLGLLIGGLAIGFSEATDHPASDVLFSGQDQLPDVVSNAASWSVGALLLLMLCKALAYAISLSTFRGGPVFPAMFIGAAGGVAAAELPGMELVPAVGMGIGAMCAVMLTPPAHVGPARDAADGDRRPGRDAGGDRRGRRGLRAHRAPHARARPGSGHRRRSRRCTIRVSAPPAEIITMLTPRTANAPGTSPTSPTPAATPR